MVKDKHFYIKEIKITEKSPNRKTLYNNNKIEFFSIKNEFLVHFKSSNQFYISDDIIQLISFASNHIDDEDVFIVGLLE
jgi:hypothetical protein